MRRTSNTAKLEFLQEKNKKLGDQKQIKKVIARKYKSVREFRNNMTQKKTYRIYKLLHFRASLEKCGKELEA